MYLCPQPCHHAEHAKPGKQAIILGERPVVFSAVVKFGVGVRVRVSSRPQRTP